MQIKLTYFAFPLGNVESFSKEALLVANKRFVIGGKETDHDLSALKGKRLRTHGSLHEAKVPFILSEPLKESYQKRADERTLRSREIFEYALNGIEN